MSLRLKPSVKHLKEEKLKYKLDVQVDLIWERPERYQRYERLQPGRATRATPAGAHNKQAKSWR